MTRHWRRCCARLVERERWLMVGGAIGLAYAQTFAYTNFAVAQITPDGTLLNNSSSVKLEGNTFNITGGTQAGSNLFHSFGEFSIPNGGTAFFHNAANIQNIISRVTGGSVSNIDGLIRANGTANLFLLNPNGIIFGPHAQLQIGGSFLATTANRLNFADGSFFSTTDTQTKPLLTVSVPSGLQFGRTAERIVNQSIAQDSDNLPVGLQVQSGKTLALVGGDVFLDGGVLVAPGGRVELGSVAANSLVSLTPVATGWTLGYEGVRNFQDIQLSNNAGIDVSGDNFGDVQLRGKRVAITGGSQVGGYNSGANSGGTLVITAADAVIVSDGSSLNTIAFNTGKAGDIKIETRQLIVNKGSYIDLSANENASGQAGDLTVNASEFVVLEGNGGRSYLTTQTYGDASGGNVTINTGVLVLNSSIIGAYAVGGNGGNIRITAKGLFLSPDSKIIAGTQFSGIVQINTLGIDLSIGFVNIPELIAQGCPASIGPRASKFVITGRGGLPPSPSDALISDAVWIDLNSTTHSAETPPRSTAATKITTSTVVEPLVEATGWVLNDKGQVVLTADVPTATPYSPQLITAHCHVK